MRASFRNHRSRRAGLAWGGVAAAVIAVSASETVAGILTCVGPAGEVLYSNLGCPPGYALRANTEEGGAPPAAPAPAAEPAEPGPPPQAPAPAAKAEEAVDERCAIGSFQTQNSPGSIGVNFTNSGARACRRVHFYCLWGLGSGMGFYQQSGTASYEGLIDAGATVRVGEMRTSGPAAGDVSWSWCTIRGSGPD